MKVAEIILDQIKQGTDTYGNRGTKLLMCWGASNFMGRAGNLKHDGYLQFSVKGFKFKGIVLVQLDFDDTYTVKLKKKSKGSWIDVYNVSNVYCDQLTSLIDSLVETDGFK